jgi:hypothetical protein
MSEAPQAAPGPADVEVPPPPGEGASVISLADQVRKWGMVLLLWAFVGTSTLSLTAVLFLGRPDTGEILRLATDEDKRELAVALEEKAFDRLKQILQILLPAQTALLGSAMGFYYGSQARGSG